MAKGFHVKVYEDCMIISGDGVKVPIVVTDESRLIPILKGLAEIKPKKTRGLNKPKTPADLHPENVT